MTFSPKPDVTRGHPQRALRGVLLLGATTLLLASACGSSRFESASDSGLAPTGTREAGVGASDATVDAPNETSTTGDAGGSVVVGAGRLTITGDLKFGAVPCGSTAPSRTLVLENTGAKSFTFTATLSKASASPYVVTVSKATVSPHAKETITVSPAPIPATSAVPGTYGDTLVLRTDITDDVPHLVPITESATGAILAFGTSAIPFGEVPVSSGTSSTFQVFNHGNLAAKVGLSISGDPVGAYSVTPTSQTVSETESLTANVTFSPKSTGKENATLALVPAPGTTLCAPLPKALALTGVGENGGLALSSNALSFGAVACGKKAAPRTLTLTNSGNAPLTWSASLANTSPVPYALSPMTGSLQAGASATLTVTPGAIPTASSVQENFYADSITFTTDVIGDEPHLVSLSETARGAILAINPATNVDFGDVPVDTTASSPLQVVNSGNAEAHVTVGATGSEFSVSPSAMTTVGAGSQANFDGEFAPGSDTAPSSGTFSVTTAAGDVLCAPLPAAVTATGTGANGVVAFTPGSLAFGDQTTNGVTSCGGQAAPAQVTFSNNGNQDYTITPSLENGANSAYSFSVTPSSGVVKAGGTATITVTPAPIPQTSAVPGDYGDTLEVTTDASGDTSPHLITLSQGAYGAILTSPPSALSFPDTPANGQSSLPVGITNSGNAPATLTWTGVSSTAFAFDANVVAPPGGVSTSPLAYFRPTMAAPYSGTATFGVKSDTILCQPIDSTSVSLAGTGTNGSVVSVTPAQVNFNMVSCGSSGGSDVVTIKNNSVASIMWNASLPNGSSFTLSTPTSGTLAAGASATVTVTSTTIPVAASTTTSANGFGSMLTVTTTAANDSAHQIPILETASGAILAFSPTTLNLPPLQAGSPQSFEVVNTGNIQVTASVALVNPGNAALTLGTPTSGAVVNGTPYQGSVTAGLAAMNVSQASVSVAVPSNTVLCQSLPAPMALTAN